MSINFGTHIGSQIVFVGTDGKLKVRDYSSVHGDGTVNVTVVANDGSNLLSLNLSADKAQELYKALGALFAPPTITDRIAHTFPVTPPQWAERAAYEAHIHPHAFVRTPDMVGPAWDAVAQAQADLQVTP